MTGESRWVEPEELFGVSNPDLIRSSEAVEKPFSFGPGPIGLQVSASVNGLEIFGVDGAAKEQGVAVTIPPPPSI